MVHDVCDYCFREFGYKLGEKAICMSCGLENVRKPAGKPEAAMLDPKRIETATRPAPTPRRRRK